MQLELNTSKKFAGQNVMKILDNKLETASDNSNIVFEESLSPNTNVKKEFCDYMAVYDFEEEDW